MCIGRAPPADLYEEALVLHWARSFPQFHFQAVLSESAHQDVGERQVGWVMRRCSPGIRTSRA